MDGDAASGRKDGGHVDLLLTSGEQLGESYECGSHQHSMVSIQHMYMKVNLLQILPADSWPQTFRLSAVSPPFSTQPCLPSGVDQLWVSPKGKI